jgi:hypothetical protein
MPDERANAYSLINLLRSRLITSTGFLGTLINNALVGSSSEASEFFRSGLGRSLDPMVFVRATAYRAGLLSRKQEFIRVRLLYLHNGMVLRPKIHVAVGASVGMMLPSNVYVGPKARPYRSFLAQMTRNFDPQPLRQGAYWPDAGPSYAKVPASFKQYTFEEISLFRFKVSMLPSIIAAGPAF